MFGLYYFKLTIFFYSGIWALKRAGTSAYQLQQTRLKNHKLQRTSVVANCVRYILFQWPPYKAMYIMA